MDQFPDLSDLTTIPEAAKEFRISDSRIRQLVASGRLAARQIGQVRVVRRSELAEHVRRTRQDPRNYVPLYLRDQLSV